VPDEAHRNVWVGFVFAALLFGTMLRLASRSAEPSGVWLELAFGFANLVAINWILVRLVRQVRRLQASIPARPWLG
jgi:hypothetical protein